MIEIMRIPLYRVHGTGVASRIIHNKIREGGIYCTIIIVPPSFTHCASSVLATLVYKIWIVQLTAKAVKQAQREALNQLKTSPNYIQAGIYKKLV